MTATQVQGSKDPQPANNDCSCYGALPTNTCCTCESVVQAYATKGWKPDQSKFKQCSM
jgi:hypothetical protein